MFSQSRLFYQKKKNAILKPPYEEQEVLEYEEKHDIRFPEDFRNYLINISRETIGGYPQTFSLNLTYGPEKTFIYKDETDDDKYYDWIKTQECSEDEHAIKNGFHPILYERIIINGCTGDFFLCVKGKYYGHLLSYNDYIGCLTIDKLSTDYKHYNW
jgi:hypothetical protein